MHFEFLFFYFLYPGTQEPYFLPLNSLLTKEGDLEFSQIRTIVTSMCSNTWVPGNTLQNLSTIPGFPPSIKIFISADLVSDTRLGWIACQPYL